ncbi:MAG: hypothetical protein DWQ31_11775 [Planctomycetota bacterium]|nr:MAG: hypothetical protein DWQ31_11775 [Planctomycetota bacterium]
MKKSLYVFGGLIVLSVAFDMAKHGSALVRVFACLFHEAGDPPPEVVQEVAYVALHLLALAAGVTLCGFSALRASDEHSITSAGRRLHALAGVALLLTAAMIIQALLLVRGEFESLAEQVFMVAPFEEPDSMRLAIASAGRTIRSSFLILTGSGFMLALAGLFGLQRWPPRTASSARRALRIGIMLCCAILTMATAAPVYFAARAAEGLQGCLDGSLACKPQDLADGLLTINNSSLIAAGILGLLGALQLGAALVAPQPDEDYEPPAEVDVEDEPQS